LTRTDPFAAFEQRCDPGFDAALALQLAFALCHDHFQAVEGAGKGFFQGVAHGGYLVAVHAAQPPHTQAFERGFYGLIGVGQALAFVSSEFLGRFCGCGDDVLRAGGRGVAVFEDQQHRIITIEEGALHAGEQAVVPKTAVAHDGQGAPLHHGRHACAAGQAHAVAQDGMAL
jgi:hypothetical protein